MKKTKFWVILVAVIVTITFVVNLCACSTDKNTYTVSINFSKSVVIEVGDEVDYKEYFTVTDQDGNQVTVTDAMIDTSKVDTTKEGQFTVTLKIGSTSKDLTFTVINKEDPDDDKGKPDDKGDPDDNKGDPDDLSTVLAKYTDISKWNFAVIYQEGEDGVMSYEDYYEYCGKNILYKYDRYDDNYNFLGEATDYLGYSDTENAYYLYYDNLNGSHSKYKENTTQFTNNYYLYDLDLTTLGDYTFTEKDGVYEAAKPNDVGNTVVGEFTDYTWTKFTITIANGNISQVEGTQDDGYIMRFEFSKYGSVSFTLPDAGTSSGTTPTGTMEKQTYDAANFDNDRLQQKLTITGSEPDPYIGLPSKGEYHALVIPVQFAGDKISDEQLANLELAFNDTEGLTGWESVKSYYYKASYQKLNLSFDIQPVYQLSKSSSYYDSSDFKDSNGEKNGSEIILKEVLAGLDPTFDFSPYDWNNDGALDAVYLIYSADVVYGNDSDENEDEDEDESIYWAYVTWDNNNTKYDGKDAFYYLFAGVGFMDESVQGGFTNENYPVIDGLKINASTYIHETGHLLGLDDYYDYYPNEGCNEGLGSADMMDMTVGDQNVYSKTMLGWLTPTVVNSTQTVTISSSQAKGDAILIPLNFNNSYFCEYLLIDLYSAQGLNELHASVENSYLYDGATYGVRIYHVSSSINNPFSDDYGSFTDCNNSMTDVPLIKLVEADGETKFASSDGWASESDLWQAGDTLSGAFPQYTTNAGKLLIFDIEIVSVSESEATIRITYNA